MAKLPSHRLVKQHLVYTVAEVAELLGVHRQTVRRWITKNGLAADCSMKPWLISGSDLASFLRERQRRNRRQLRPGEIFCGPCRTAKKPAFGMVDYRPTSDTAGMLIGLCPDCGRLICRFASRATLNLAAGALDVRFPDAPPRIVGAA